MSRGKEDGFQTVTFETARGARIIYDFRYDSVVFIPAIPGAGGAVTLSADEFVAALEESRRQRTGAGE